MRTDRKQRIMANERKRGIGEVKKPKQKLKDTPTLIKLPSGFIQPSPWLAVANKQLELMQKFIGELGLSPASRSRVSTMPSLAPKPWDFAPAGNKFGALRGRRDNEQ
jgi:hypothetical protein